MDRKKLEKLQRELDGMRHAAVKAAEVQSLAKRLGRSIDNRGKHPMWVSDQFGDLRPLSIPDHGSRDLSPRVKKCSLDQLQEDIDAWAEILPADERKRGNGTEDYK